MSYFIYANITLITRVTRRVRVLLVEQELLTLPEYLSSLQLLCGFSVVCSFVFWIVFCRSLFVLFLLTIVLSVLLQIVASDDPFGIFKCDKMTNKITTLSEHFINLEKLKRTLTHKYMIVHFHDLIHLKTINNCEKDTQIFCSDDRTRVQEQIARDKNIFNIF